MALFAPLTVPHSPCGLLHQTDLGVAYLMPIQEKGLERYRTALVVVMLGATSSTL
jgi:hypothetical protein